MSYTHLTEDDRYDIYERKGRGESLAAIAEAIGRSKSTICRELKRNTGGCGYRPKQAQKLSEERLRSPRGGKTLSSTLMHRCRELISEGFSPAQAAGRARLEGYGAVSHERLYKLVYADKERGGQLWRRLRCCKKRRKRYGSGHNRRGKIPGRVGIEHRCKRVEARATVGHWEGDTVIGKNHKYALVTLVERKSGFALVRKVKTRRAGGVAAAIIAALKPLGALVRTVTFDNGLEFAQHLQITAATGAKIYFADPYSSWQRGSNENLNGLLRQYFPKKSCFSHISEKRLNEVQKLLNTRARKRHGWLSPEEVIMPSAKRAGVALAV